MVKRHYLNKLYNCCITVVSSLIRYHQSVHRIKITKFTKNYFLLYFIKRLRITYFVAEMRQLSENSPKS